MKYLWRTLLGVMLLVPAGALLALFTEQGSERLLNLAQRLTPLEVSYVSGSFSGELRLRQVRYHTASMRLQLDDIITELAPGCAWRSTICFRQLTVGHLDIELVPGADEGQPTSAHEAAATDAELVVFPVALEAPSLALASVRVAWQDGEWRQGPAQIEARLEGSTIEVTRAAIDDAHLALRESSEPPAVVSESLSLPRIDLPLQLTVHALQLERPSWSVYGQEHRHIGIHLQGHWLSTNLELTQLHVEDDDWGVVGLQGTLEFAGDWPLQATLDASLGQPPLWAGLHGRDVSASIQGSFSALALQLTSPGSPAVTLDARLDVLDRQLPFEATLNASGPDKLSLANSVDLPAALADVQLELPLSASVSGTLREQQFQLQSAASGLGYPSLQVQLAGVRKADDIRIENLSLSDPANLNQLHASGELQLGEQLRWSLSLASSGLDVPRLGDDVSGRLEGGLQLTGAVQGEDWQVAIAGVDLRGEINDLPAQITGFAGLGSGMQLAHSQLEAELNAARLSLYASGNTGESARLELAIEHLGRWQPDSRGRLQLQADLTADRQRLDLSGALQDVAWRGMEIANGTFSGDYQADREQAFTLDTRLAEVRFAAVGLQAIQLTLSGNALEQSLLLSSRGDIQGELAVKGSWQGQQWRGLLAPTRLQLPNGSWQLDEAVGLAWPGAGQQLSIQGHCWRQSQAQLCPGELLLGRSGRGSLEMAGDMSVLTGLLSTGAELSGDLQLMLEASWDAEGGFLASGRSETRSVLLTQYHGEGESASVGWDRGVAELKYDRSGLHVDWALQRDGRKVLGLELLLPPEREQALRGTASLEQLQLSTLAALVPSLSTLEGSVTGQLQLSGTVDQPLAHGVLTLSDGRLAMVGNPTELESLDVKFDLRGNWAELSGKGILGGGELRLAGQLNSDPELRLELSLQGAEHRVLYPPSTRLLLSEDLKVVVTAGLLDISGNIVVHEGVLEFEQLPEGSVAVSADVVEVDYAGNVVQEELPFDIRMDIRVAIRDHFKVTGSLLQATLGGELHVLQQPGRPLQLFGNLATTDGELRAYQQRLQLRRGTVSFSGRPDNPSVSLRAQRNISGDNVKVGVQVRGRMAEELELEVYSEPAMSEAEAMSYLLRGRGMDAGAAADGTAMAVSMAGGVLNRSTIVSELNRIPGVSNIEFGAESTEDDTAATLSGYIGGRIYLSYGVGLYEPINVLTARLYLRPRLWLEVVSRLENSVDLYYSFDIK